MKKYIFCLLAAFAVALLFAEDPEPRFEKGCAVIRIKDEYKAQIRLGGNSTGIGEVDNLLRRLDIRSVQHRFKTSPKVKSDVDLSPILELRFAPETEPRGICNALARLRCIAYAEPIGIDEPFDTPSDYFFPYMCYFDSLYAAQAWSIHKGQNGASEVVLAIVDTGVNWKHPDLAPNIWNNLGEDANANGYTIYFDGSAWVYDAGDLNGIDDDGNGKADDLIGWDLMYDINGTEYFDPWVSSGHGTNVSGIANARTDNSIGVCSIPWNVKTMAIRCTPPGESGIYRGYDGIIYAAENGADVINCSWGGIYVSQANQDALYYAWSLGAIVVAASGNYNNQIPIYPTAYERVVSVGTVRNNGTQTVCTYGPFVDVCAPMDSVYTVTGGSGYSYVGIATSYASPIGTGLCALIKSYHPEWTNQQVITQLMAACDDLNPYNSGKINLLGYGRLNAWQALADTLILPTPGLKLAIQYFRSPTETNGNLAVEPGEQFSLNFRLRNYACVSATENLALTLTTSDPDVTVLNGSYTCAIGADSGLEVTDAFLVQVSTTATAQYVTFYINCSADLPILNGASLRYDVLVNGPGIYIWEGFPNVITTSGTWLNTTLSALGYSCALGNNYNINGNRFAPSLLGFDAVFLSFGAVGSYYYCYAFEDLQMFDAIRCYLEAGGKLYLEGGDALGYDLPNYFPEVEPGLDGDDILWPLLGLESASDGGANTISLLSGEHGWHTLGLAFMASTQTSTYCQSQDLYTPSANGIAAFEEDNYGAVAVQGMGSHGQRTFVMSYTLKCLTDAAFPSTKAELLNRILAFFFSPELTLPEISGLEIAKAGADSIRLSWEYPFPVDHFSVLGGDTPAGVASEDMQVQETEAVLPTQPYRFYQVKACKAFGM